jgi:pyrroline-5-carboxylate reductase
MTPRLLLVGCGKMGEALLSGWRAAGFVADDVLVVEPDSQKAASLGERFGVSVLADGSAIGDEVRPAAVVFAVKPQALDGIAPAYRRFAASGGVFLSIAAGRTIASLKGLLGERAVVVRAMPNTPAAVGMGATVACAGGHSSAEQRRLCERLLATVGSLYWVDDEALLDAVTAVSGSGPAYVFLLTECLAQAGAAAGLPAELAARLARDTVSGAGALLHRAVEPAAELRRNVTSPGGTTAAALAVLMAEDGLAPLLTKAVRVATARSRELAG